MESFFHIGNERTLKDEFALLVSLGVNVRLILSREKQICSPSAIKTRPSATHVGGLAM